MLWLLEWAFCTKTLSICSSSA